MKGIILGFEKRFQWFLLVRDLFLLMSCHCLERKGSVRCFFSRALRLETCLFFWLACLHEATVIYIYQPIYIFCEGVFF